MFNSNDLNLSLLKLYWSDKSFHLIVSPFIDAELFENKTYKNYIKFINSFKEKYKKLPTRAIIEEVANKKASFMDEDILQKILNKETNEETKSFIKDEMSNIYKKVKFTKTLEDAYTSLMNKDEMQENDLENYFGKFRDIILNTKKIDLGMSIYEYEKRYDDDDITTIPLGVNYPNLTNNIDGGFYRGSLYSFQAPTGYGKSVMLQNMASELLLNGYNVIYYTFTTELSEIQVGHRFDCRLTKKTKATLYDRPEFLKEQLKYIEKLGGNLMIKELPSRSNILDIDSHVENLRITKDFQPDAIIVDYADYLSPLFKEKNWNDAYVLTEVFRDLKNFARVNNVVLLTASQTNREALGKDEKERGGTKEDGSLTDTSRSAGKNEIADFVGQVIRTKTDKKQGITRLHVLKNRFGVADVKIPFRVNAECFLLSHVNKSELEKK